LAHGNIPTDTQYKILILTLLLYLGNYPNLEDSKGKLHKRSNVLRTIVKISGMTAGLAW
jgi:hypothetical protein